MGGIGLSSTNPHTHTHTPVRTYTYAITHTYICIPCTTIIHLHRIQNTHICSTSTIQIHTICTQFSHNPHTHKHRTTICSTYKRTQKQNTDTETNIPNTENNAQPQHRTTHLYTLYSHI